jgi:histidine ammonia-lyase
LYLPNRTKSFRAVIFTGEALAMMLDYLAIGVSEMCSISERRVSKLLNPTFSELPAFLAQSSGLQSGLMITQYTSAALVSENKILSHPIECGFRSNQQR